MAGGAIPLQDQFSCEAIRFSHCESLISFEDRSPVHICTVLPLYTAINFLSKRFAKVIRDAYKQWRGRGMA